jgi:hypothetical protein
LATVAITLTIGLITLAYGQMPTIEEQQKAACENSIHGTWENGKCMVDSNVIKLRQQLENSIRVLQAKQQGFEALLNYCFQHAERPNPVQDLVDKGFMSENMTGITCKDVRQMSDTNQNQISDLANKLNQVR